MKFLKKLFGKKPSDPNVEEEAPWVPPSAAQARRRLMLLWANSGRSYLETEYPNEPNEGRTPVPELRDWVHGPLKASATPGELARHDQELGSWTERQVVDDTWDREAGVVLLWGLGLRDRLPDWDKESAWDSEVEDLFQFPDPGTWNPILTLRDPDIIEEMAQAYEARYWRLHCHHKAIDEAYGRKLMRRASILGQVELASDGDLAFSDGTSIIDADARRLGFVTSICVERLHALNWLCGQEEDWDLITCDTIVGWLRDENWDGDVPKSR